MKKLLSFLLTICMLLPNMAFAESENKKDVEQLKIKVTYEGLAENQELPEFELGLIKDKKELKDTKLNYDKKGDFYFFEVNKKDLENKDNPLEVVFKMVKQGFEGFVLGKKEDKDKDKKEKDDFIYVLIKKKPEERKPVRTVRSTPSEPPTVVKQDVEEITDFTSIDTTEPAKADVQNVEIPVGKNVTVSTEITRGEGIEKVGVYNLPDGFTYQIVDKEFGVAEGSTDQTQVVKKIRIDISGSSPSLGLTNSFLVYAKVKDGSEYRDWRSFTTAFTLSEVNHGESEVVLNIKDHKAPISLKLNENRVVEITHDGQKFVSNDKNVELQETPEGLKVKLLDAKFNQNEVIEATSNSYSTSTTVKQAAVEKRDLKVILNNPQNVEYKFVLKANGQVLNVAPQEVNGEFVYSQLPLKDEKNQAINYDLDVELVTEKSEKKITKDETGFIYTVELSKKPQEVEKKDITVTVQNPTNQEFTLKLSGNGKEVPQEPKVEGNKYIFKDIPVRDDQNKVIGYGIKIDFKNKNAKAKVTAHGNRNFFVDIEVSEVKKDLVLNFKAPKGVVPDVTLHRDSTEQKVEIEKFEDKLVFKNVEMVSPKGENYKYDFVFSKEFSDKYDISPVTGDSENGFNVEIKEKELITPDKIEQPKDKNLASVYIIYSAPEEVSPKFMLFRNSKLVDIVPIAIKNGYLWKDIPRYDENGKPYEYQVKVEPSSVKGYKVSDISGTIESGFAVVIQKVNPTKLVLPSTGGRTHNYLFIAAGILVLILAFLLIFRGKRDKK